MLWEAALDAGWEYPGSPGEWVKVERRLGDGHTEDWWALEVEAGPYGLTRSQRAVVATTDPQELPERKTWYLVTNLSHPSRSERPGEDESTIADIAEVLRLYGLRMWVEQSYKQVKHVLGWSDYQVRSDLAMRRHWRMVLCAFSFCWWAYGRLPVSLDAPDDTTIPPESAGRGKKVAPSLLAGGTQGGKGVVGAVDHAQAILEGVLRGVPAQGVKSAA